LEVDAIAMSLQLVAEGLPRPLNAVRAGMSSVGIIARPIVKPALRTTIAVITLRRPNDARRWSTDILRQALKQTPSPKGAPVER
jgi:hypothetical protein